MKKYLSLFLSMFLISTFFGCGDNKTKEKLIGTAVITENSSSIESATPSKYSSTLAANSANMVSKMGQGIGSGYRAPLMLASTVLGVLPPGMTGPDGDGYYTSTQQGTVVRIKFMNVTGAWITFDDVKLGQVATLNVKITSQYSYGEWKGDFNIKKAAGAAGQETVTSGTITSADPVGGSFKADIVAGMLMDSPIDLPSGAKVCVPLNGSMTLTSDAGYKSTMTYDKSGTDYTCVGDIVLADGTVVAKVYLTYNKTFGNYTGYYTDKDGVRFEIAPQ